MINTTIKRVVKAGVVGFFRNTFVSLATILVMSITLFVIGSLLFMNAALESTLTQIKQKVDINAYFLTTATEEAVLEVKTAVERLPEVARVEYISREESLLRFKERHRDDQLTLQALEELEENPLGASLTIQAKDTGQYEVVAKFLEGRIALSEGEEQIIEKVNYHQNKVVIDRLSDLTSSIEKAGLIFTIFLTFASVMIVFNTIRLAIYTNRDEIEVMQLVGASNWFVNGPYIIEGILYGLVAGVFTLFIFYPLSIYLGSATESFFGVFNSFTFYVNNFGMLFKYIVGSGVVLGAVSSFLAIRRYLGV
ncbi:MAG: ABC transporter permease [Candidatus Pacebacteria bacterium]|nr:ABC transporter permease [Candidatus Paceibacterota bacterium]